VLIAIGIFLIIAGLIIIFFGNREIPVRGGIVRLFDKRPRLEDDSLPASSYRFLFGGAFIVGGVMVLLKALNLA